MDDTALSNPDLSQEERLQFCRAVASIIGSDRRVTEDEWLGLVDLTRQAGLTLSDGNVKKTLEDELSHPSPIESLVTKITNSELRRLLYRTMVEIALSDGELAKEEETRLTDLAKVFSFNPDAARDLLHWVVESIKLEAREQEILSRL